MALNEPGDLHRHAALEGGDGQTIEANGSHYGFEGKRHSGLLLQDREREYRIIISRRGTVTVGVIAASPPDSVSSQAAESSVGTRELRWFQYVSAANAVEQHYSRRLPQDAQNGCPARPQRAKRRGVPSGVH